jgi:hypothetical protein
MKLRADTLRLILGLTYFEAWPPARIARALGLFPRDVVAILEALREFQVVGHPHISRPEPRTRGVLKSGVPHDLF